MAIEPPLMPVHAHTQTDQSHRPQRYFRERDIAAASPCVRKNTDTSGSPAYQSRIFQLFRARLRIYLFIIDAFAKHGIPGPLLTAAF
jgi:hypothetical protein